MMDVLDGVTTELDRRGFLRVTGTALAALSAGGTAVAQQLDAESVDDLAWLIGPDENRPPASDFSDYNDGHWVYWAVDTGAKYELGAGEDEWAELPVHLAEYAFADLPTDLPTGSVVFDENRNLPTWWDQDHYEFPSFVDDVLTTPVTVDDTTTRTSVFNPDINANSLFEGRIYQLDIHGTFGTANTSDQFTVDVDLAGTDVAGLQNSPANVDPGTPWTLELTFTVRSHGVNGELKANTRATFNEQPRTADHTTIAVDTTQATELEAYITWDTADPENVVVVEQAHLKQMG